MSTTALFAEILVAGIQALLWVGLIAVAILRATIGLDAIPWDELPDWMALITLGALSLAYAFGIIIDRAADVVAKRFFKDDQNPKQLATDRAIVRQAGAETAQFAEYQRSRLRVARSTALNAAIGLAVTLALTAAQYPVWGWSLLPSGVMLALLAVAGVKTWRSISESYFDKLKVAAQVSRGQAQAPTELN